MLACLPASGDLPAPLLYRTQMNTGLQKWETPQKMRSANYPTPAELDAYANKVANSPLTIQIFPNSVKVPQRKHIRRTVNGLDTSSSSQRHSPYPTQVSARAGLLAVLRAPDKGIVKESDGSRARLLHKAAMNPHGGPYATQSTLNLSQPAPNPQGLSQPAAQPQASAAQKQGMAHPQSLARPVTLQQGQTMSHPQSLQQRNMAHSQALQRQQSLSQLQTLQQQQSLAHPPGIQRQQSLQQQQGQPGPQVVRQQQQHLPHLQTLQHQATPHQQALLQQQAVTQDLQHMSDGAQLSSLQHSQGPPGSQPLTQAAGAGPPATPNGLQQQPLPGAYGPRKLPDADAQQQPLPGAYGPRKLPDADAPPNVTVSTSTIPLSMASSLHQNRPSDLSSIVNQINQFCQARAGMGATSVCEGQIANPGTISRNLLINASSRVSMHNPPPGSGSSCLLGGTPDKLSSRTPAAALQPQPNMAAGNSMPAFHTDREQQHLQQIQQQLHKQKQQLQQQQQHQQLQQQQQLQQHHQLQQQQQQQLQLQQLQQQRSWNQHQLAHMQQPPEGAHPCKNPRREAPSASGFASRNLSYPHKLPNAAQAFPLKHPAEKPPSVSPINAPAVSMPYTNGHYMQPPWASIPATANNNGSGPQDLPITFQGGQAGASMECIPGAQYRPGAAGPIGPAKLMQNVDFLAGDFQVPAYHEQNLGMQEKMHRPPMGQAQEPGNGRGVHAHHPGYR